MKQKNYGKDISSVNTPVRFHLPDGSTQYLPNSQEAQAWFDQNYADGYSLTDYVPTQGDSEHPIQLQEVIVTAPAPKKKSRPWYESVGQWFNDEVLLNKGNIRVRNYNRALQRNPQFSDDWDMASNIAEGVNIMSGGVLNRLSPTQNIGLIIDVAKGKNFMNSWFGNSGIVSDNFAQQHPYLSFGINAIGDLGTYYLPRGIKPALQGVQQLGTTAARHLKNAKLYAAVNEGVKHIRQWPYLNFQVPIEDSYLYHTHQNPVNGFVKNGIRYNKEYSPGALHIKDGKYASSNFYSDDPNLDKIWWDKKGHNSGNNVYVMKEDAMPIYKISDPESKARPGYGLYLDSYRTTKRPDVNNVVKFTRDPIYGYTAYSPYRKYTTNRMSLDELFNTTK